MTIRTKTQIVSFNYFEIFREGFFKSSRGVKHGDETLSERPKNFLFSILTRYFYILKMEKSK
jgi:hypothetical protein